MSDAVERVAPRLEIWMPLPFANWRAGEWNPEAIERIDGPGPIQHDLWRHDGERLSGLGSGQRATRSPSIPVRIAAECWSESRRRS